MTVSPQGAGDLTAAVFLGNHLEHDQDEERLDESLASTTSSVFAVVEATAASDGDELAIVAAQDRLAHPRGEFTAERVR